MKKTNSKQTHNKRRQPLAKDAPITPHMMMENYEQRNEELKKNVDDVDRKVSTRSLAKRGNVRRS